MAFAVPSRPTVPTTPPLLCKVAAMTVLVAASVMPVPLAVRSTSPPLCPSEAFPARAIPPAAPFSTIAGPVSTAPVFSAMPPLPEVADNVRPAPMLPVEEIAPVPDVRSVTSRVAVSAPDTARAPVSVSVKSWVAPVTAKAATVPMAFAVPSRTTVPTTLPLLCNVAAMIVLVVASVIPVPLAIKSTNPPVCPNSAFPVRATPPAAPFSTIVGPVNMAPVFSAMPPEPEVKFTVPVAPMLPETPIEPVFASLIVTLVAVTGPVMARLPVLPLSASVKVPPLTSNLPRVLTALLRPRVTPLIAVPVRVAAVRAAVWVMVPFVSSSTLTVGPPNTPPMTIDPAVTEGLDAPGAVVAPRRRLIGPMPDRLSNDKPAPEAPSVIGTIVLFGASSKVPPVTVPPAAMVKPSVRKLTSLDAPAPRLPVAATVMPVPVSWR